MDHRGRQVGFTDVYTSRDGAAHALDLLYEQDAYSNDTTGYRFPWRDGGYNQHALNDTFPGLGGSAPGSIYIKGNKDAPDGDETDPQGAITYSSPPDEIRFLDYPFSPNGLWALHYRRTVPASGALTLAFVYSEAFLAADVYAMASAAEARLTSPAGGQAGGGSGSLPPRFRFAGVSLRHPRLAVRRGRATLVLGCPGNAVVSCVGTAKLSAPRGSRASAGKRRHRPAAYGRARFSIRAGAHRRIVIKLDRTARRALRRHHGRLRAVLTLAAHDRAGHRHTRRASTTLVARRAHRRR